MILLSVVRTADSSISRVTSYSFVPPYRGPTTDITKSAAHCSQPLSFEYFGADFRSACYWIAGSRLGVYLTTNTTRLH